MDELNELLKNYKVQIINIKNNNHDSLNELNQSVSKFYVINLLKDKLKRNYILILFRKLKINFTLVVVDKISVKDFKFFQKKSKMSIAEAGCLLSHLWCLNDTIQNNYSNSVIFEDDIIIHKNFKKLFLEKIKENKYDFLLLGACDFSFSSHNFKNVSNCIYFPSKFENLYGAHANYYSLKAAKFVFEEKCRQISFFDNNYNKVFENFKNSSGVLYPNIVVSDISSSDLNHTYQFLTNSETYYYRKCFKNFNFSHYFFIYPSLFENFKDKIENCIDVEEFVNLVLYNYFHDENKIMKIKSRINMDIFSLDDLKLILR